LLLVVTERPLRERRWGEESVVFDPYSGETHYLKPLASAIFRRVAAAGAVDFDALCSELAQSSGAGAEPTISPEEIGSAAGKLHNIGLIGIDDSEP